MLILRVAKRLTQKSKSRSAGDADRLFLCGTDREKAFDGLALVREHDRKLYRGGAKAINLRLSIIESGSPNS